MKAIPLLYEMFNAFNSGHLRNKIKDAIEELEQIQSENVPIQYKHQQVEHNRKIIREKICSIFSDANMHYGQFMPQSYVNVFLDLCENKNITFKKELYEKS